MTSRDRTPLMPTLLFTSLLESGYPKVASTGSWWRRRWLCERTGTQPHSQHKRPSPPRHQPALTGGDLSPHSAGRQQLILGWQPGIVENHIEVGGKVTHALSSRTGHNDGPGIRVSSVDPGIAPGKRQQ